MSIYVILGFKKLRCLLLGIVKHFFFAAGVLPPLPWSIRMKIVFGAAKGLAFLHEAEKPVIYRDFKTSNILLDLVSYQEPYIICTAFARMEQ